MDKSSSSSNTSTVKVQDILRIFETEDNHRLIKSNNNNSDIQINNNSPLAVDVCSWSLRHRKGGPLRGAIDMYDGRSTKQQQQLNKRVSAMVQRFQGKQLNATDDVSQLSFKSPFKEESSSSSSVVINGRLPKGPAPQKPTRTFEHDIYLHSKGLFRGRSVDAANKPKLPPKPVRSKTVPAMNGGGCPRTPPPPRPILKGVGGGVGVSSRPSQCQYGRLKKSHSAERIYDEPWCSTWGELRRRKTVEQAKTPTVHLVDNDIYLGEGAGGKINHNGNTNKNTPGGELHYMSSPLFSMGGGGSNVSRAGAFPTPLTTGHTRVQTKDTEGGLARRVNFVDEDVLNWSFMSIYDPSPRTDGSLTARDIDSGDSDSEISEKELQKRIDYVHKINRSPSIRVDLKEQRLAYRKQFDAVLIVGLRFEGDDTSVYQPYVKNIFPQEDCLTAASPSDVAHFCFPDAQQWKPASARETYTFVLTNEKGDRLYGYCRRVKPEGVEYNIPVVYCILSPVLDRAYYAQLLREIEKRHGLPETKMKNFIQTLYSRAIPQPGKTTVIRRSSLDNECQVALSRSNDYFADNWDTSKLLTQMPITTLLKIFSSFLLERRVLFCASQPEILTETIHSLVSLLYPFHWPHTFIPILPNKLIEVVASPTPYIIGILSHSRQYLDSVPIDDDGMMVDLDTGVIVREVGDETTIIPKKVQRALTTALKLTKHRAGQEDEEDSCAGSCLVAESFLRMFIELVGHYQQYMNILPDGKRTFDRESFVLAPPSRGIQTFLKWFTETQIFDLFVESVTTSPQHGVFEERIRKRQLDMETLKPTLRYNVKEFSKKMKTFGEKLIGLRS